MINKSENANFYSGIKSHEVVSKRLAHLKEHVEHLLLKVLTLEPGQTSAQNQGLIKEFFDQIVMENHPDLLIDIAQHWLMKIYFKLPSEDQGVSYDENLTFVLQLIENKVKAVMTNVVIFKRWLSFLRIINFEEHKEELKNHIQNVMQLENFSKSILKECVEAFLMDRVVGKTGASFSKQDNIQVKMDCFDLIMRQLIKYGLSGDDMYIFH